MGKGDMYLLPKDQKSLKNSKILPFVLTTILYSFLVPIKKSWVRHCVPTRGGKQRARVGPRRSDLDKDQGPALFFISSLGNGPAGLGQAG